MTEPTNPRPVCPLNCCGVQDCIICRNPVTGLFEFDDLDADDNYPPEDAYVGYNEYGDCIGG